MAKDPALLFYTSDFLTGTMLMNDQQVGKYIRTMCLMHQSKGKLDRASFDAFVIDPLVRSKFEIGDKEVTNNRLLFEMQRRQLFCESRRISRSHGKQRTSDVRESYVERMETETANETITTNTTILNNSKFDDLWNMYPKRIGRKQAFKAFKSSVRTDDDLRLINAAMVNYKQSERVLRGFVQNGSTWFNNWQDWVEFKEDVCLKCKGKGKYVSSTGYEIVCSCPKGVNP